MSVKIKTSNFNKSQDTEDSKKTQKRKSGKTADQRQITLQSLSDELLLNNFLYLSPKSIGKNVRLVCKRWHVLSQNVELWQSISKASERQIKGRKNNPLFHANVKMSIPEQCMIEKIQRFDPLVPKPFESVKGHLSMRDLEYDKRVMITDLVSQKTVKDYQKGLNILLQMWFQTSGKLDWAYVGEEKEIETQIQSAYTKTCIAAYGRYFRKLKQTSQEREQELKSYKKGVKDLISRQLITKKAPKEDVKKGYLEKYNGEEDKLNPLEREYIIARGELGRKLKKSGKTNTARETAITEQKPLDPSIYTKGMVLAELLKSLTPEEIKKWVVCLEIKGRLLILIGEEHVERFQKISLPFKEAASEKKCAYFWESCREVDLVNEEALFEEAFWDEHRDTGYLYGIEEQAKEILNLVNSGLNIKSLKGFCPQGCDIQDYMKGALYCIVNFSANREILKELAVATNLSLIKEINDLISILEMYKGKNQKICLDSALAVLPSANQREQWFELCHSFVSILVDKYELSSEMKTIILNVFAHPHDASIYSDYTTRVEIDGRNQDWRKILLSKIPSLPEHIVSVASVGRNHLKGLVQDLIDLENAKLQLFENQSENFF